MDKNMETEETKERKEVLTIVIPSLWVFKHTATPNCSIVGSTWNIMGTEHAAHGSSIVFPV